MNEISVEHQILTLWPLYQLGWKFAMGSWQVEAKNRSGQLMPKGLGTWKVFTSFPLGLFGNPNPTNSLSKHDI